MSSASSSPSNASLPLDANGMSSDNRASGDGRQKLRIGPRLESMSTPRIAAGADAYYRPEIPKILMPRRSRPLRSIMIFLLVLVVGTLLGISSAYFMIERERPFIAQRIGPWTTNLKAGTSKADPYSVAIYTRSARIPLAQGEGLALVARQDSNGNTLDPACTYKIVGKTPTARLWTLSAGDDHGNLRETLAGRNSLASWELLRKEDDRFDITASATPSSGNWLPLAKPGSGASGLTITFRLYDAPVTTGASLEGAVMPDIVRVGCS